MSVATNTNFAGLKLANPIIVGSCPLTLDCDKCRAFADAGASALVMPSLFEEQIEHHWFDGGKKTPIAPQEFPVSLTFKETLNAYNGGQLEYLHSIERVRKATSLPIIASLNGVGKGDWLSFGKDLQSAGSSAIEVTLYRMAMDADQFADDIEQDYLAGISYLCRDVTIPIIVKMLPFFTSLPNFCLRVQGAGAAAVTLFGRYPQCNPETEVAKSRIHWELSEPGDVSLSRRWLSVIRRCCPKLSLAASGGAASGRQAMELMKSGADVVMVTSPLYREGSATITRMLQQMSDWADEGGHGSLNEVVGENCRRIENFPQAYERCNVTDQLTSTGQGEDASRLPNEASS